MIDTYKMYECGSFNVGRYLSYYMGIIKEVSNTSRL